MYLKYKFGKICYKTNLLQDNLKIANTSTMIKEFSDSNPNLRIAQHSTSWRSDRYQNILSS